MPYPHLAMTEVSITDRGSKAYRCILFELDEDNGAASIVEIAEANDITTAIHHVFHHWKHLTILPKCDSDTDGAVRFGNHYGLLIPSRAAAQRYLAERPYDATAPSEPLPLDQNRITARVYQCQCILDTHPYTPAEQKEIVKILMQKYDLA
jgi:hypothetical protein